MYLQAMRVKRKIGEGTSRISFRDSQLGPTAKLILKPAERVIVDSIGKAIVMPLSTASLKSGTNTDVISEPEAEAVVGQGGITHTESDLDPKTPVRKTLLPFYGGARGQTLQITETADGTVTTNIIQTSLTNVKPEEATSLYELEHPELPKLHESPYAQNIKNIHSTALNIIKLQETAKQHGLTEEDEVTYKENMESLNQSAQSLAEIYNIEDDDSKVGLSAWFARKKTSSKDTKKKEEEEKKKKEEEAKRKKDEEDKKKKEEEDKKKREEEKEKEEEQEEEEDDGISVNLPAEDASVAEAKPVGLAVAGIGGVAASKPIATAVVGPGGLAVARPVGTAIAGVSPDQALVPIYAEGYIVPSRPKGLKDEKKTVHTTDYLNKIISKYHQIQV